MYGREAVDAASAAISGEERFNGLFAVDADLKALPAHQALLAAYEKLQAPSAVTGPRPIAIEGTATLGYLPGQTPHSAAAFSFCGLFQRILFYFPAEK